MSLESRRPYLKNCDRCSHCKWTPNVQSERFASACPSIDYGQFHTFSANGKAAIAYGLLEGKVEYSEMLVDSVYACTMCGGCDLACKFNHAGAVEPLDTLYALRQRIAQDGMAPPAAMDLLSALRQVGNPYGKPREARLAWLADDTAHLVEPRDADTLLHIGCENAFDAAAWPDLRTIADLLTEAGVRFFVSAEESATGELAYDLGFRQDAQNLAEGMANLIRRSGVRRVVTCSAPSYAAFRNIFPRLGVPLDGVEIVHVSQAIDEALTAGRITRRFAGRETVTYHDPCKLGRLSEPYQAWTGEWTTAFNQVQVTDPPMPVRFGADGGYGPPRSILGRIEGVDLVEMERNARFAYCCGAGAGAPAIAPEMADQTARQRLDEACATGATTLVSGCASCTSHLREVAVRHAIPIAIKGLFELLAETTS